MDKLILASGSPRRKMLLEQAGYQFTVVDANIDETIPTNIPLDNVPVHLAEQKAAAVADKYPGATIIAADTVVILDHSILGKPSDAADAIEMLRKLSGKVHLVVTGVCIRKNNLHHLISSTTEVHFKKLDEETIAYYVDHFKPLDKAGAYAIQEWIGLVGIEKINGDYYNVMGLPVVDIVAYLGKSLKLR